MKKLILAMGAAVLVMLAACSSPGPRTVEAPAVAATNASNLDVTSVELTDTATILKLHCKFRPGWWVRLDTLSHLVADGKDYPMLKAEGIEPGKRHTMPESGEDDFTLFFAPVPFDTKSVDFTEGTSDGWAIYGIDLTGKPATPRAEGSYPEGLPKELRDIDMTEVNIEPVLEVAPTELRFHMLGWRPEYGSRISLLLRNPGEYEEATVNIDENGEGTLSTTLYGPTMLTLLQAEGVNSNQASLLLAPGGTTDIYFSPDIFSDPILARRGVAEKAEAKTAPDVYDNGRYAPLNRILPATQKFSVDLSNFDATLTWRATADEYTDRLVAVRDSVLEAIGASSLPDNVKTYLTDDVVIDAAYMAMDASHCLANKYYGEHGMEGLLDSVTIAMTPAHYERLFSALKPSDSYLMHPNFTMFVASAPHNDVDLSQYSAGAGMASDIAAFSKAYSSAKSAKATDEEIAALTGNPFFAEAVKTRQAEAVKALEEAGNAITPNPEVADDKLFDAIVAPHKGKVVLVDLWNTWCGPCRNDLKANEPLKSGELASDDIVWIYIADESSDLSKYTEMIKDIKGEHHLVNASQIGAIRKRFNVDGIPYYIVVTRDGKATGRPDLRDHTKLVSTLKGAL